MGRWGNRTQGFRRMAARNKPAGIRVLVYWRVKGKAGIEGLSVSGLRKGRLDQAEHQGLFGRFLAIANGQRLVDTHGLVADGGDRKA